MMQGFGVASATKLAQSVLVVSRLALAFVFWGYDACQNGDQTCTVGSARFWNGVLADFRRPPPGATQAKLHVPSALRSGLRSIRNGVGEVSPASSSSWCFCYSASTFAPPLFFALALNKGAEMKEIEQSCHQPLPPPGPLWGQSVALPLAPPSKSLHIPSSGTRIEQRNVVVLSVRSWLGAESESANAPGETISNATAVHESPHHRQGKHQREHRQGKQQSGNHLPAAEVGHKQAWCAKGWSESEPEFGGHLAGQQLLELARL